MVSVYETEGLKFKFKHRNQTIEQTQSNIEDFTVQVLVRYPGVRTKKN